METTTVRAEKRIRFLVEVRTISYTVQLQTEPKYKHISYGQGTIYSSACGPASLCNVLHTLGIADVSLPTMCKFAEKCGARVEGGTWMAQLLCSAAPKYRFSYRTTSKNAELLQHLKNGGAAILHAGTAYPLFSTGGHFVAAVHASGNTITVLDSYWYSRKYKASAIRRNYISILQKGVVKTSLQQCGKATIDRSPSYYLISKEILTEPEEKEEEDSMKYYKKLEDVPEYYRKAVQKLVDHGAIRGTGDGLNLSEDLCRMFTILDKENSMKYYKRLEDVPEYYRKTIQKLVDNGAIAGTGDGLNLSEDLCRAFTILDQAGLLSI